MPTTSTSLPSAPAQRAMPTVLPSSGGPLAVHLSSLAETSLRTAAACEAPLASAADLVAAALLAGRTVYSCGNGGSAADAQHFTAELVGRMDVERAPLRAVTLGADFSTITALGNDYGYEQVFSRPLRALAHPGDVLVAISTSGSSPNVVAALDVAADQGVATVLLTGARVPAGVAARVDSCLPVPSTRTAHVQELHIGLLHVLCLEVEARLFGTAG